MKTTVLNALGMQMYEIPWQRALVLLYQEKADLVGAYDIPVRSPSVTYQMPRWIRLKKFKFPPPKNRTPPLSKRSLYNRDEGRCGYCREKLSIRTMTVDHIIPRSQGGKDRWENCVTACEACNRKKGAKTPQEAGMSLKTRIYIPRLEEKWLHTDASDYQEMMAAYMAAAS